MEIDTIPTMRIYLKGEKKKPKVYKGDVDLLKILEFFRAYFSSKIEIGTFTTEEIEEIALELMSEEDRNVFLLFF